MAVINDPIVASNMVGVGMSSGTVWRPAHVASGPLTVGTGGGYRISMVSGTIPAALAANSELAQFRYVTGASRVCIVHGISVSAGANVAATAAALLSLRATIARAWSADGSGGTAATLTGNINKLDTQHATCEATFRMVTTAALGAGTKTLDSQDIGGVSYGVGTGAITTAVNLNLLPKTNLLGDFGGSMAFPLILRNQEGFVVRSGIIGPATMTWNLTVDVSWSEVQAWAYS
jgi:hypothetical protein